MGKGKIYAKDPNTGKFVQVPQYDVQPYNDGEVKTLIQGNTNRIQTLESGKVGKKTIDGGEVFNSIGVNIAGELAHAEGEGTKANAEYSHTEGVGCVTNGVRSHAEGNYTITSNTAEHAQGSFNKSNTNTLDSIGIGSDNNKRKNATETLRDGKHYILGVGGYDGTNAVDANAEGIVAKDVATFLKDGGALHALLANVGLVWNAKTGYYEYKDYKQITLETAISMYVNRPLVSSTGVTGIFGLSNDAKCSIMLPNIHPVNIDFYAQNAYFIETIYVGDNITILSLNYAFEQTNKLKEIKGIMNVQYAKKAAFPFNNAYALEEIRLKGIKDDFSFKKSANLSKESLLYMINNEATSGKITITLEATAYARLNTDGDVQTALASHPNIQLGK